MNANHGTLKQTPGCPNGYYQLSVATPPGIIIQLRCRRCSARALGYLCSINTTHLGRTDGMGEDTPRHYGFPLGVFVLPPRLVCSQLAYSEAVGLIITRSFWTREAADYCQATVPLTSQLCTQLLYFHRPLQAHRVIYHRHPAWSQLPVIATVWIDATSRRLWGSQILGYRTWQARGRIYPLYDAVKVRKAVPRSSAVF
jgi:hypothetical protein